MSLQFRKENISDETFESAGFIDVTGNGIYDIVSGAYWYEGPDFIKRHFMGHVLKEGEYYDDFSTIPMDVNGNGRIDVITGGWWGKTLKWRENPGVPGREWPEHIIAECGSIETARAWDIDNDGDPEIIPNTPGNSLTVYKLREPGHFTSRTVYGQPQGHGLGCGDLSGNGRPDIILSEGWLEAPEDPWSDEWIFHPEFSLGRAGIPVIAADVNGDGLCDIIAGQAHGYGLSWFEQTLKSGKRSWIEHPVDTSCSQYHDMKWIDIDGDSHPELITGKRYRAHCGRDPGADDPVGIYCFRWTGTSFSKEVIDQGDPEQGASGCGIFFDAVDITGNGLPDILAPGKEGLYLFYNECF